MNWQAWRPTAPVAIGLMAGLSLLALGSIAHLEPLRFGAITLPVMSLSAGVLAFYAARSNSWSPGTVAIGCVVGAVLGLVAASWFTVAHSFESFERTGLPSLLAAVYFLPGLAVAGILRRPGAVSLGLFAGTAVALGVTGDPAAPRELLAIPIMVVPAEAWLALRRHRPNATTLATAGALLGTASFGAVLALTPEVFPADTHSAELVVRIMAGTAAGWLSSRMVDLARERGLGPATLSSRGEPAAT